MAISWPSEINRFVAGSGLKTLADGRLQSATDIGPGKVRRRTASNAGRYRCAFYHDDTERTALENFFIDSTGGGALPFDFTPCGGQSMLVMFAPDTALSIEETGAPGEFLVRLELLILP